MPPLYNCHTDGDGYRITKFDRDGEVESTYLTTDTTCECPAGHRHTCRHRQMLPMFRARGLIDSPWFVIYATGAVVDFEGQPRVEINEIEPSVTSASPWRRL
jgi:hypothetical protein